jgi:outer membrane protein OmpA-like peptidoglycan-associated protein
LTKQATLLFGEANVKAQINVASNTPTECVEATKATLPFLKSPIERGQFEARNGQLRLQGHVATSAMRQKMEEAIGRGIGKMRLISELTVDVEATPAPDQRPVATGTPIPVNVVQQQLNTMVGRDFGFPGGRKTLSPIQERALNRVAAILRQAPDATVEIGGHYRGGGSKKANDDHSWDCVRAVVLYLVEQGVPDSRMIGVGYGDRFPERGSASGTRIEFRVNAE